MKKVHIEYWKCLRCLHKENLLHIFLFINIRKNLCYHGKNLKGEILLLRCDNVCLYRFLLILRKSFVIARINSKFSRESTGVFLCFYKQPDPGRNSVGLRFFHILIIVIFYMKIAIFRTMCINSFSHKWSDITILINYVQKKKSHSALCTRKSKIDSM